MSNSTKTFISILYTIVYAAVQIAVIYGASYLLLESSIHAVWKIVIIVFLSTLIKIGWLFIRIILCYPYMKLLYLNHGGLSVTIVELLLLTVAAIVGIWVAIPLEGALSYIIAIWASICLADIFLGARKVFPAIEDGSIDMPGRF